MEGIAEWGLDELKKVCPTYYERGSPQYEEHTKPWSTAADRHPMLVVVPKNLTTLQKVVKALSGSILDFAIRGTGTGSSSAYDAVVSMQGFKSFEFNPVTEIATVGAGLTWGEVDKLVDIHAPGYGAVGARCPWVGVAGCALVGGISWLSLEHGLVSDSQNLIDAQVVLQDGRVVWAQEDGEEDLMWALRGGGGNFGVVSALKIHLKRVSSKIFSALVTVPYSSLAETSKAVAAMHRRPEDPKVAMFVANQGPGMGQSAQGARPGIVLTLYDVHGEAHARSEAGFAWAFRLPGAVELGGGEMTLSQVNALPAAYAAWHGTSRYRCSAPLISDIDDEFIVRLWKWYEDTITLHQGFENGSSMIFEMMQEPVFNSVSSPASTAWPHARGRRHVMQVALVTSPEDTSEEVESIASTQLERLASQITAGHGFHGEYFVAWLQDWNDLSEVYGENWDRLLAVKRKYDPEDRFYRAIGLRRQEVSRSVAV